MTAAGVALALHAAVPVVAQEPPPPESAPATDPAQVRFHEVRYRALD